MKLINTLPILKVNNVMNIEQVYLWCTHIEGHKED